MKQLRKIAKPKTLLLALLALNLTVAMGCRSSRKGLSKRIWTTGSLKKSRANLAASKTYVMTDAKLKDIPFQGMVEIEDANISYQHGLKEQATCIANQINDLNSHIEASTGLKIRYRAKIYLLRLDQIPQNYRMTFKNEPNAFTMPLFVPAGDESCEAIVARNMLYPAILVHETVEMSLCLHKAPGTVLGDSESKMLFFKPRLLNYTRWFRDGMAEYAAVLAQEVIPPETLPEYPIPDVTGSSSPFSALSKVGTKLFKWHQYSKTSLNNDYYDAALGLFLLITDKFGQDAIKEIAAQIGRHDYLDGKDLIEIIDETFNTDLRKLVSDFHFPDTGLKLTPLTKAKALNENLNVAHGLFVQAVEPNSPAHNAAIREKDVILEIGDTPVRTNLGFERTLFGLPDPQKTTLLIYRRDKGEIRIQLPLACTVQ